MQPKHYDKEILERWHDKWFDKEWSKSPKYKEVESVRPFQHFTDGFVGAMVVIGTITVGYQLVKLFTGLFS